MLRLLRFLADGGHADPAVALQSRNIIVVPVAIGGQDTEDVVFVLNYDQAKSPRGDAVCRACRGSVVRRVREREDEPCDDAENRLRVGPWELVARSFLRFFQAGERVDRATDDNSGAASSGSVEGDRPQPLRSTPRSGEDIYAQSKEDGTLVMLWFDRVTQRWRGSCRFNLLDDFVSSRLCTYRELFQRVFVSGEEDVVRLKSLCAELEARGDATSAAPAQGEPATAALGMGEGEPAAAATTEERFQTAAAGADLDPDVCYSFELCTPLNRVVTPYPDSSLYLLAGFRLDRDEERDGPEAVELSAEMLDQAAERMGARRPARRVFESHDAVVADLRVSFCAAVSFFLVLVVSLTKPRRFLQEKSQSDPTFEGYVLCDTDGFRLKAKNPGFFFIHKLRYRGWVKATPERLVPFVLADETHELMAVLSQYDTVDTKEIRSRLEFCELKMHAELDNLKQAWLALRELGKGREFHDGAKRLGGKTWSLLHTVMNTIGPDATIVDVEDVWRRSAKTIIRELFTEDITDRPHDPAKRYCAVSHLAQRRLLPSVDAFGSGLASVPIKGPDGWKVSCHCGQAMVQERLKADLHEKRYCFCGGLVSVGTLKVPTVVWKCPQCPLFHNAESRDGSWLDGSRYSAGDPMGIPSSAEAKVLRLMVHGALRDFMSARGLSFEDAMKFLAAELACPLADVRVARLGAPAAIQALEILERSLS
jgi:hypothetical protein